MKTIRSEPSLRALFALSCCFFATLVSASRQEVAAQETVKIVSSLPRTGSANAQSTSMVNGIRMAIDAVGGKVGKFTVKYEDWDGASPERGQWDPAVEAQNADKAVADPQVIAYVGTYNSGAAKISMPKLNRAGLVMVSPATTYPGLTKVGTGEPNEPRVYRPSGEITFFRVVPADDIQGAVAARWAKELGAQRVFIIHDREVYGKGIATVFKKASESIGLQVLGFEGIDPKVANFRALATRIRQLAPQLVFFGGTTQTNAGQIAKDLRSSGLSTKFMVPDGCYEQAFIEAAGADALNDTTYVTFGGIPPERLAGKGKTFYESYRTRFGSEPAVYAAYAYEATTVILDALRRADSAERAAIARELRGTKDFEGVLGRWSFDAQGDIDLRTMSGTTVKNGKFEFVKLLE